jgi:hypothetical protein
MTVSTTSEGPYDRIHNILCSQRHATTRVRELLRETSVTGTYEETSILKCGMLESRKKLLKCLCELGCVCGCVMCLCQL